MLSSTWIAADTCIKERQTTKINFFNTSQTRRVVIFVFDLSKMQFLPPKD
jgi:hypothetical protein